jgi:hypothetical protein
MSPTRRQFIRNVGIALATLVMGRCQPPVPTTLPTSTMLPKHPIRNRLRDCWLAFERLAKQTRESQNDPDAGEAALRELRAKHQAALDEMVSTDELSPAVAEQVQAAFDAASYHIWRSNTLITCYAPALINYSPTSSAQLVEQSAALAAMAQSSALEPSTVEKAQAAIERDIAFLNLSQDDVQLLYDSLITAAGGPGVPPFDEVELGVTAEAIEAARFLVSLLLCQDP